MSQRSWLVSVALAGCALVSAASAQAAGEQVKIAGGTVEGTVQARVLSFKGIPFAAPPVGDLRWRAPQPVKPWTGVRPATAYGHDCAQLPFPGDAAPLGTPPDEDCLVLNVWRPAERPAAPLPVMVWIYGGGFVNGGSSPAVYDGSPFAKRGVVFVSFNYRVGRFGFFAHPALSKEPHEGPLGNYGYMDQIAALQWVQRNIAAFGGDPGNVTVFGQSAGAGSIAALLVMPAAAGLFRRAILQSLPATFFTTGLAADIAAEVSAELSRSPRIEDLAEVAPDDLVAAARSVTDRLPQRVGRWGAVVDLTR
jgi:para-nitrobenzyl esterase